MTDAATNGNGDDRDPEIELFVKGVPSSGPGCIKHQNCCPCCMELYSKDLTLSLSVSYISYSTGIIIALASHLEL